MEKLRKHRVEMTPEEIAYAETVVHSISFDQVNTNLDHFNRERHNDWISLTDVRNTLKYGDIIEVNSFGRCVVRLMKGMAKGTCVVIDVRDKKLVTAWRNNPRDNHETLRLSEYGWNVNVVEYLGGLN